MSEWLFAVLKAVACVVSSYAFFYIWHVRSCNFFLTGFLNLAQPYFYSFLSPDSVQNRKQDCCDQRITSSFVLIIRYSVCNFVVYVSSGRPIISGTVKQNYKHERDQLARVAGAYHSSHISYLCGLYRSTHMKFSLDFIFMWYMNMFPQGFLSGNNPFHF